MRTPTFPSIFAVILLACATIGAAAETRAGAVVVPAEPPASVVDEPLGARYSLGMTLWHLGHNAQMIARFHDYVKTQGLTPEKLLAESALEPPRTTTRMLVEPELLGKEKLGGWDIDQDGSPAAPGTAGQPYRCRSGCRARDSTGCGCSTSAIREPRRDLPEDLPQRGGTARARSPTGRNLRHAGGSGRAALEGHSDRSAGRRSHRPARPCHALVARAGATTISDGSTACT